MRLSMSQAKTASRALAAVLVASLSSIAFSGVVTNTADSGAGSLRQAVAAAAVGELITFSVPANSTITLSTPITVSNSVTISGLSVAGLRLSGNGTSQILINTSPAAQPATLRGLTLTQGSAALGGAIANSGGLTLDRVAVVNSRASAGGGGIHNTGTLLLLHSEVSNNTITDASGIGGGGILSDGGAGSANLTLLNTTVAFNTTAPSAPGMAGGGIAFTNGALNLLHSTVARNSAPAGGANIHQGANAGTTLRLRGSIITDAAANSAALADSNLYQPGAAALGALAVGGFNVVSPRSGASGWAATDVSTFASSGVSTALAANGGRVNSLSITSASPAAQLVPAVACLDQTSSAALGRDVRGVVRGFGDGLCDAGAFEIANAAACNLDINADSQTTAEFDGVLLSRYLFGFRGNSLVNGVPLNAPRATSQLVESFIGTAAPYDVFGRSAFAPKPMADDLVIVRLIRGTSDANLLTGIAVPNDAEFVSAAAIRAAFNARCGTTF